MTKDGNDIKVNNKMVLTQFWRALRPDIFLFFVSLLFMTVSSVASVTVPIFYKSFFDTLSSVGIKTDFVNTLVGIIVLVAVLHFIQWFSFQFSIFSFNRVESKTMVRLKQNAFDYLILHSHNFFVNNFAGSLVQKVNRFSRSFEKIADAFIFNFIPLLVLVVGAIAVTYMVAPVISLVIVGWVVFYVVFNIYFSKWKSKYDILAASADSQVTGVLSDNIANYSAINLFGSYNKEAKEFKDITDDYAKKLRKSWNISQTVDMFQAVLMHVVEFVVFYYAILFWAKDALTVGTFVLIQVYVIGLAYQLWSINRIVRTVYESMSDSREMVEILHTPYEIKNVPNASLLKAVKGEIDIRNASFSFNETREVLHSLNFSIKAGEKIALVGASGAGKTTLVRLIMRLYDLTSGQIFLDGQDISKVTLDSLHEAVSFVPQDPVLFHRSLMDNIRYGRRDATDEEVYEVARLAHCDEFIKDLPNKYETFVGERGVKLSGGERQRVAIARAMLKKSPILILDEATSSLDSESESLIQDALDKLMKNRTTIVIAHRLSTIRKMDRIVAMQDGVIVEDGSHEELLKNDNGLYKKLWSLQVSGFIQD